MADKFVFAADLHLQPNAWAKQPGLAGDAYFAWQQIVQYCVKHKLPLILGGDVFDRDRPDPVSVSTMFEGIDRLKAADCKCYFIQGQHEMSKSIPWLACHPWCRHLDKNHTRINGADVVGLDWRPQASAAAALAELAEGDIDEVLVMHQAWDVLMRVNHECTISQVPPSVQLLLTGDFHVTAVHSLRRGDDGEQLLHVASPGSTCMQSIDEPSQKFFAIVNDSLQPRMQRLLTRPFYSWQLADPSVLPAMLGEIIATVVSCSKDQQLPEYVRSPIIRVLYPDGVPGVLDTLVTSLAKYSNMHFLFATPVVAHNQRLTVASPAAPTMDDGMASAGVPAELQADLRRLVSAADPGVELVQMRQEFINKPQ